MLCTPMPPYMVSDKLGSMPVHNRKQLLVRDLPNSGVTICHTARIDRQGTKARNNVFLSPSAIHSIMTTIAWLRATQWVSLWCGAVPPTQQCCSSSARRLAPSMALMRGDLVTAQ